MPRDASGVYTRPPGTTAVTAAAIGSVAYNNFVSDLEDEMSDSLSRSGQGSPLADLDWGGYGLGGLKYLGSQTEASVASAGTCDILGSTALFNVITGTTTITSLGTGAKRLKFVRFAATLTLTHNATSLILPGGANITTAAGDTMLIVSDASSNVRVLAYQPASLTLAAIATSRILGRSTAGTGNVEALTGASATALLSAFTGDSGSGGVKGLVPAPAAGDAAAGKYLAADGTFSAPSAVSAGASPPQGRLTLVTATPVMTTTQLAKTSIFYTPYKGLHFPWYNGSATVMTSIGAELTLALDNNAGHTGYHQSGKNFDLFLYSDSGTIRLVSGPAWTSDTVRSAALAYKNGFLTNSGSMTARYDASASTLTIAANQATFVGSFRASANGQTQFVFGASAAGGTAASFNLANYYNQVKTDTIVQDSNAAWSYTTATWRSADNSAGNRVSYIDCSGELSVVAEYAATSAINGNGAGVNAGPANIGVGIDSTSSPSGITTIHGYGGDDTVTRKNTNNSRYAGVPGLGWHFIQALEKGGGSGCSFGETNGLHATLWL